jgi:hypothetical protein
MSFLYILCHKLKLAKSAEVVIPGCLVAALISAFVQLEALNSVQQAVADGTHHAISPTASNDETKVLRFFTAVVYGMRCIYMKHGFLTISKE